MFFTGYVFHRLFFFILTSLLPLPPLTPPRQLSITPCAPHRPRIPLMQRYQSAQMAPLQDPTSTLPQHVARGASIRRRHEVRTGTLLLE